ncbi:hypothetical protein SAMN05216353_10564 [Halobacillus alkaliphilus]|uniref:Uncharacterized protein n=1 Tax=Halobacillus alkaliphilus TaxID=396056 RepID=A0A1I2KMU0_9BACI|nr:hypothetical protein [Halobacillus alkaliphilus]SFF67678.1 hypothetical protein SAMN05216353_10564 [Halobacillus alkaliphilus]
MKKILLLFVVVIIAIGGYFGYMFFIKSHDTADEEVDQLADEAYEIFLPNDSAEGQQMNPAERIESYETSYEQLIHEAERRMDEIVTEAQKEYVTKKQNGEDISFSYFFSKYNSAADRLEASTDEGFQTIHESVKENIGAKKATDLKEEFRQTKKQWRANLLAEVKGSF